MGYNMGKLLLLLSVLALGPLMLLDLIAKMVIPEPVVMLFFGVFLIALTKLRFRKK